MNSIRAIWQEFVGQDEDTMLPFICKEILEYRRSGILADGQLRDFARKVAEAGYPGHLCLAIAEQHCLDRAVRRVANL